MHVEDTLLVPKLELAQPTRKLPQSFAPVRPRRWPWIVAAAIVLATVLLDPIPRLERRLRLEKTAVQLRASLHQ